MVNFFSRRSKYNFGELLYNSVGFLIFKDFIAMDFLMDGFNSKKELTDIKKGSTGN